MAKEKTFNDYKIIDNVVEIYVVQKNGREHTIIIDKKDFAKIRSLDCSIHVQYHKTSARFYAHASLYLGNKKYKNIIIHTFLFGLGDNQAVDHINGNSLDNREENIRYVTDKQNEQNRKSKNINNKSGYRNVCWIDGYWRVQLQVDGKNYRFPEKFSNVDEAGKFAEGKRKEIYGDFAGFN